jgi:hypothetical protein
MLKGYMSFLAEAPIIGLDPHPAYAPDPAPEAYGAHVWARLYHVEKDKADLEREAQEDLEARRDAYELGDMEDFDEETDQIFPVTVSDSGTLTVMDPDGSFVLREYTPPDIYRAFGMSCPEVLADQRAEAWAVIRSQLEALAEQLRTAGAERVETEYLLEDGIAGLQELRAYAADGAEVETDFEAGQLPPLVFRSEFGKLTLAPNAGQGSLNEHAEIVFESLAELILDEPGRVVDRIGIRLASDGTFGVEVDSVVTGMWTPPGGEPAPDEDGPGGP